MAEWTPEAREYLEGYLKQVGALAMRQGDDVAEVLDPLRDHAEREAEAMSGSIVTLDTVLKVLSQLGAPGQVVGGLACAGEATGRRAVAPKGRRRLYLWVATPVLLIVLVLSAALGWFGLKAAYPSAYSHQRAIAAAERLFLETEHQDSDADGDPDYGTIEDLVKSELISKVYLSPIGAYRYRVELKSSSERGGPDFSVLAAPLSKPGPPLILRNKPDVDAYEITSESR